MANFFTIITMAAVGALIGGFTNYLAIKMLFRPHYPLFIKNWRVPFTPGLIPKRKPELAKQLGLLVVNHLLTPQMIREKLLQPEMVKGMADWLEEKLIAFFRSKKNLAETLEQWGAGIDLSSLKETSTILLQKGFASWLGKNRDLPIGQIVPETVFLAADEKIPDISKGILEQIRIFVRSDEGKDWIRRHVYEFLQGKRFGGLFQIFIDNALIVDRLQEEAARLLSTEESRRKLESALRRKWNLGKEKTVGELVEWAGGEKGWMALVQNISDRFLTESYLMRPISDFLDDVTQERLAKTGAEKIVSFALERITDKIPAIMEKLQIAELIRQQVETFSSERLEELVLAISRRELKMITYLGAYLGGLIGIVQGIFAIILQ